MFQTCRIGSCLLGKGLAVVNKDWVLEIKKLYFYSLKTVIRDPERKIISDTDIY